MPRKPRGSQLAREFVVAVLIELSHEQQIGRLQEFIQEQLVEARLCANVAIHDTDGHNPHAHILLAMRPLNENGTFDTGETRHRLQLEIGHAEECR